MARKKFPKWATTVTPFSKMLALAMLIFLPILGFYYGIYYQKQMDASKQKIVVYKTSNSCSQPPDGQVICRTNSDCPANYTCEQAGPIRADGETHRTCWEKGHAVSL